ncbi:lipopolysaccharide biosynthesis protein [Bdellovibrio bacteriovorus]|uniref:lipopolysaccharide biosynthesis protein n=1 Tax=Bdellovibrio bacteriovorus TaxID=959 RepID=UPI0035A64E6E
MINTKTLFSTVIVDFASKALAALLGFVLIRNLGSVQYAEYSVQIAIAIFAYQIGSFSINQILMSNLSELEDVGGAVFFISAMVAAPILLSAAIGAHFATYCFFLSLAFYDLLRLRLYLLKKYILFSVIDFGKNLTVLSSIYLLTIKTQSDAANILYLQAGCIVLLTLSIFLVYLRKSSAVKFSFRPLLILAEPHNVFMLLYLIFSGVVGQIEIFFLKTFGSSYDVAVYATALRYYVVLTTALNTMNNLYFASAVHSPSAENVLNYIKQHMRYALVACPIIIVVAALSNPLMEIVNKGKYPEAFSVFLLLVLSACISLIFSPSYAAGIKLRLQKTMLVALFLGITCDVTVNFFLTPEYRYYGAAMGLLVGSAVTNITIFLLVFYRQGNVRGLCQL